MSAPVRATKKSSPSKQRSEESDWVAVSPELAAAVLCDKQHAGFAAYLILRAYDSANNRGRGFLDRRQAVNAIEKGRGVSRRQAQRLLRNGEDLFWQFEGQRVWLAGIARVVRRFGVSWQSRAHRIPITDFHASVGAVRSTLTATQYRPDKSGMPKSRRWIAQHTGVPAVSQRRHDAKYGHIVRVRSMTVAVAKYKSEWTRKLVSMTRHFGFFEGRKGWLMRRHPDIRMAVTHRHGYKTTSWRVNREMRTGTRPAIQARGQRQPAAYFPIERRAGIRGWLKTRLALGKSAAASLVSHPFLNYAAVQERTRKGRLRWVAIRENDDVFGVTSERG